MTNNNINLGLVTVFLKVPLNTQSCTHFYLCYRQGYRIVTNTGSTNPVLYPDFELEISLDCVFCLLT